jgi:hypothetical protein
VSDRRALCLLCDAGATAVVIVTHSIGGRVPCCPGHVAWLAGVLEAAGQRYMVVGTTPDPAAVSAVRDALAAAMPPAPEPAGPDRTARTAAWLTAHLAEHGGRAPVADVKQAAARAHHGWDVLYQAADDLGVIRVRDGRRIIWQLPAGSGQ